MGDAAEEFPLIQNLAVHGPDFKGHLQYRFGMWLFNVIFFKLFGISETTFFLPTWVMSSSLSVIGYYILLFRQYRPIHALFAGLFIASAPFEILIGTVRANDLILSWFLAMGFLFFVLFEKKHVLQGLLLAFFLWFAFYVKLWAIYLIPALLIYYIVQTIKDKIWYG
ncbi:MAG TPA: glycosyltransferase family 39 protein, partial [Candidatus Brocadiaceae bacterium]